MSKRAVRPRGSRVFQAASVTAVLLIACERTEMLPDPSGIDPERPCATARRSTITFWVPRGQHPNPNGAWRAPLPTADQPGFTFTYAGGTGLPDDSRIRESFHVECPTPGAEANVTWRFNGRNGPQVVTGRVRCRDKLLEISDEDRRALLALSPGKPLQVKIGTAPAVDQMELSATIDHPFAVAPYGERTNAAGAAGFEVTCSQFQEASTTERATLQVRAAYEWASLSCPVRCIAPPDGLPPLDPF